MSTQGFSAEFPAHWEALGKIVIFTIKALLQRGDRQTREWTQSLKVQCPGVDYLKWKCLI